jgi:Glutathione S-transferase N-terminal domain
MTQDNGGMIKLHGCSPAWSLPDCSPFVTKIDCYLRMTGLQYELIHWQSLSDIERAPNGKIPWIEDGAKKIADSGFIISYLQETYGDRLEEDSLSPSDRAVALSMRRMVEEHLYWAAFFDRWIDDDIWSSYKPILFGICTRRNMRLPLFRFVKLRGSIFTDRGSDVIRARRSMSSAMPTPRRWPLISATGHISLVVHRPRLTPPCMGFWFI